MSEVMLERKACNSFDIFINDSDSIYATCEFGHYLQECIRLFPIYYKKKRKKESERFKQDMAEILIFKEKNSSSEEYSI